MADIERNLAYLAQSGDEDGPFRGVTGGDNILLAHPNAVIGLTAEGGVVVSLTNKTGSASVKGTIVSAGTAVDNSFIVTPGDNVQPIGIVYEDGIADGSACWVVTHGRCQVLLKNTTAATRGYWVKISDTNGRADATNAAPPGGGIPELDDHMGEIGHSLESIGAGTNVLCYIILHFN